MYRTALSSGTETGGGSCMNETVIRIKADGSVIVEKITNGITNVKQIEPDDLIKCVNQSTIRTGISSGLLPNGCLSYYYNDNGDRRVSLLFSENRADISYYGTVYTDFPLPKLVFGFNIGSEGSIYNCHLGVTENTNTLKPNSAMYRYPFSNVSGFHLCTGNNSFPKCKSLHTLSSLPYFILSMPNNNDHFKPDNNKPGLEMRDLLELLKDKEPEYYYSDILIPFTNNATLNDFINHRSVF